jgi:LacI family transcriptional regulator
MRNAVRKRSGIPLIAELAGVSIGTVDRALHRRKGINERTLKRVLKIAAQIGYKPNVAARSLSTGKRARIGVCVPKQIAYFYDELWAGIRDEARRYADRGAEFVLMATPELGRGERSAFKKLADSNLDGIILTPGNPESMTSLIDAAEQRGTRVVCVSTDAPFSRRSSVVCIEPRLNGLIAGELMAQFLPPGSKVAIVTGMLKTIDHRDKADGFAASFRERSPANHVVSVIEAHEHADESFRKTKQLLEAEPDLAGIYVNTVNSLPVCRALSSTGRALRVRVIATDLFHRMIPAIQSGAIAASIHQQPYVQGQLSVRTLVEHLLHEAELPSAQYLNPNIILRSNLHLFREANSGSSNCKPEFTSPDHVPLRLDALRPR